MGDIEELERENDDLRQELEDLRNELDDEKQEAFFRANELRQKLDEANEELFMLRNQLKDGGTPSAEGSKDNDDDSFETASQFTHGSARSHDSGGGSKATTATRLELDRAKREIKSLKLELVYAKSRNKGGSNNCASSQISSGLSTVSGLSGAGTDEDTDSNSVAELRLEIDRLHKDLKFAKMSVQQEKTKFKKEKEKLLQEIDRLQRMNMFNSKEISKLSDECKSKDEQIKALGG